MLEGLIISTDNLIARSWATLRDRSIPQEQMVSSAQIEGWQTSAEQLITQMFGSDSKQAKRFEELYAVRRVELLKHHHDRRDPNWDTLYWIDYFELCKSFFLEIDATYKILDTKPARLEVFMGPSGGGGDRPERRIQSGSG